MEHFEKLLALLKTKAIALDEFQDYLQYHQHPFQGLTQSLQQRKVPLKEYSQFLTQRAVSTETDFKHETIDPTLKDSILRIESIGNYLLSCGKITLEELNPLLAREPLETYSPERFFHLLLKEKKIRIEDFSSWSPSLSQVQENASRYGLRQQETHWAFYLETSEQEETFGPYRLLEEIGQGGMGSVYKAYHPGLNQTVALKIVRNRDQRQDSIFKRFQREIQIMAKLEHPGIVKIFSAGEYRDLGSEITIPYFVMEFVRGSSLEKQRDQLYLREKLEILKKVLTALEYAHAQNVLHRDLKLENILLTESREPKIADFGLAKEMTSTPETLKLTQSGIIIGTSHYLAPEQIRGVSSELDVRTDLYAIGICLYRLLSGHYPYEAQTLPDLFQKILKNPPAPFKRQELKIHPDLEAIVFKAIEKDPRQRYQEARELKKELDYFLNGYPVSASRIPLQHQFRKWLEQHHISLNLLYASLFLLFSCGSLLVFLNAQWNEERFQENFRPILNEYQMLHQTSCLSTEREQKLFKILNAIHALEWDTHLQAQKLQWDVIQSLLSVAYESRSFYWASYLVNEAQSLENIDLQERERLKTRFREKRQEQFIRYRTQWLFWVKQAQERSLSSAELNEMIFEIAQISEERIIQDLLRRIEEGHLHIAQISLSLPSRKNEFYKILVKVAGHLQHPKIVPVLFSGLHQLAGDISQKQQKRVNPEKVQYAIFLFRSLLRQPLEQEIYSLIELFEKIGWNGFFAESVSAEFSRFLKRYESIWEKKNTLPPEEFYYYRGLAYQRIQKYDLSIEDFSLALQLKPDSTEILNHRGISKIRQNNEEGALQDFNEAIRVAPQNPQSYWNRGNLRAEQKTQKELALADFSEALRLNPYLTIVYLSRGVLKNETNDFLGALEDLSQAIHLNPQLVSAYINRGILRDEMGDRTGALQDFNEAVRLAPNLSSAYTNRGLLRDRIGDRAGALEDYNQAIYLDPQDLSSYVNRAILKVRMNDWEGAIVDYSEGIRMMPEDSYLYCERARAKEALNFVEEALEDYTKAIEVGPENIHAYMQRGMFFYKQQKLEEAKGDLKQFLKLTEFQKDDDIIRIGRNKIVALFPELQEKNND